MNANQDFYLVHAMCRALSVPPSGYYAWHDRPPSARAIDNAVWRVNLDERRATIWMRTVSRRDDHAAVLFVAGVFYGGGGLSPGFGTPTFWGVA